jgi:sulfur carrier protein
MKVFLNDEARELAGETTVGELLKDTDLSSLAGWAVAVNEQVVPREETADYELDEGDRVILVQATQGG